MAKEQAKKSTSQPKKKVIEIVPSKQANKPTVGELGPGSIPIPNPTPTSVGTGNCPICDICETAYNGGFVFCHEGVPFVMDDHPATGGPWVPGWFNGQWVWCNVG